MRKLDMAPLLLALGKAGLSILASAVASKGKEVIEQKLGVDLGAMVGTEEGRYKLRELEIQHQEFLITLAENASIRDLEYFKEEVADKGSARLRDSEFLKAGMVNWRANVMFLIACLMIMWLVWIVWKDESLNEYVKGIFTLVLGRFLGYLDNIYNFEFGTTRDSRTQHETIQKLTEGPK